MTLIRNAFLLLSLLANALTQAADSKTHMLRDEFGFEAPMDAMTVTLPAGWTVDGAVQWHGRPCCAMEQMKMRFMATAPDGKRWVEFIPGGAWGWSSAFDAMPQLAQQGFAGCDARPILDVRTFVEHYIPSLRPGARITATRPRPDQAQEVRSGMGAMNLQPGQQPRVEVMEVRITYRAKDHQISKLLLPAVLFIDQPGLDGYGGMSGYTTTALALGTLTTAAVDGQADESLLKLVGDGMQYLPAYLSRLQQHFAQKAQLMAKAGARKRAAQQAWLASRWAASSSGSGWQPDTSGSDILDIQMDTYRNTSAMGDRGKAKPST